jgi:hypothetical protein
MSPEEEGRERLGIADGIVDPHWDGTRFCGDP